MRLLRLELKAFGPFTDRTLEFASPDPGLHIIFGPNEAGKSSSLRALKALLYGFPQQSADNFRHSYENLQVGGCLLGADGRELTVWRRKKRKADLLDAAGNPLDSALLMKFTQGVELALFESLYGIDHHTLVQGGEDMLAQKGEVGQALFAAGAGISSLRQVLDALEAEAEELFKPQGRNQQILQAVKKYQELKKKVKEESLSASTWKEHRTRLLQAQSALAEHERAKLAKEREVRRLERLHKAIPELAQLHNRRQQLASLGEVVVLPLDFSEQLAKTETEIREIRIRLETNEELKRHVLTAQQEITVNQAVLDHGREIEELDQRLGGYLKAEQERPKLEGSRSSLQSEAAVLLKQVWADLPLEEVETLRPLLLRKKAIQRLVGDHGKLEEQARRAQQQCREAELQLQLVEEQLAVLPPCREEAGLAGAIRLCVKAGDIDQYIEELTRRISQEQESCRVVLARLGLWRGEPDHLLVAAFPLSETVRRFDTQFNELTAERTQLTKDHHRASEELAAARRAEREVQYSGEVPSEQDLHHARESREQGWHLLRRHWLDGEDISREAHEYGGGAALPEAYEKEVAHADVLADRLRREADRVAKVAALRANIENLEERLQELATREQALSCRHEEFAGSWRAAWHEAEFEPLSPREMFAWLSEIDKLRIRLTDIAGRTSELAEKKKARQDYRTLLQTQPELRPETAAFPGPQLGSLLTHAETVLGAISQHNSQREKVSEKRLQLQQTQRKAGEELAAAHAALASWQTQWEKALAQVPQRDDLAPPEALDLIETLEKCFAQLDKATELQSRIATSAREAAQFSAAAQTLLAKTAPDLQSSPIDQALCQLRAMLDEARKNNELLRTRKHEVEELTTTLGQEHKKLALLEQEMARFLRTAACDSPARLAETIAKSEEYRRLEQKISDTESSLARLSDGIALTQIQREAEQEEVDALPGRITALHREIDEDQERIKEYAGRIGEENRELQSMDGSGRAAATAEEMERVAALIRRLVDEYTRLKVAGYLLKVEIERYREQHQDPVLRLASSYFAAMTLESFRGLRTDMSDKGEPILVGIRPDDSRLSVAAMSSGTRDQLYLALRLATLEWRLTEGEPLPFIVDDILINFDDERSRATLTALADLAEKNQVILFTHHRQVVREAQSVHGKGSIQIHEL